MSQSTPSSQQSILSSSSSSPPIIVPVIKKCPNPHCIRCQKVRQVQEFAKNKLEEVLLLTKKKKLPLPACDGNNDNDNDDANKKFLSRLRDSVIDPQIYITTIQAPTVLMMKDLPSPGIVTQQHVALKEYLSKQQLTEKLIPQILDEIQNAPSSLWIQNDNTNSDDGENWFVMFLVNQGRWNIKVWDYCPTMARLVDGLSTSASSTSDGGLPLLLDECLFGNVMVSKIYPGTYIEPHCGSSNVRHRLQITILVPTAKATTTSTDNNTNNQIESKSTASLLLLGPTTTTGNDTTTTTTTTTRIEWDQPGDYFVFDDSFVHSVEYPPPPVKDNGNNATTTTTTNGNINNNNDNATDDDDDCRIVLIVDLWHPSLHRIEREVIQQLYPPPRDGMMG